MTEEAGGVRGRLVLEDGTVWQGRAFGSLRRATGEVVFNTGMSGYQEILTDPSYAGQIVIMTYPLIGNYGVNPDDFEAARSHVRGFVVREWWELPNHWQADRGLEQYLREQGIMGLAGVDTRALTRHIRAHGSMRAALTAGDEPVAELIELAKTWSRAGLVDEVTCTEPYERLPEVAGRAPHVVLLDFGAKENIVRSLLALGCRVTVLPAHSGAADILSRRPDGLLLSNGPGDPRDLPGAAATVRELAERRPDLPVFGICLGCQILALAFGAEIYLMKFGHRGANHPVRELATRRVTITTQNHGFAIEPQSVAGTELEITHENINDGTVEGIRHRRLPMWAVQYHPEACPGPEDSHSLFAAFLSAVRRESAGASDAPAAGMASNAAAASEASDATAATAATGVTAAGAASDATAATAPATAATPERVAGTGKEVPPGAEGSDHS